MENYENDNLKNNFTILENELKLKDNEINLLKNQNRQKTNKINKLELDITNFKSIIKDLKDKNNNILLNKYDEIKQTIKLLEQKQNQNSYLNNVITKLNSQILQL
jgi:chromosome segregation ATPase